jgi:hypothetical protein
MKPPAPVTDLAALPVILLLPDIAAVYRLSISTIRRRIQNGTFSPRPWETYPYRWRRDDVAADLNRHRGEQPHRPHGFATTRARAAKAAIRTREKQPLKAS